MDENLTPTPAPDLVLVEVPSAQLVAPTFEVVLHRREDAPRYDWELLSSGFQLEAAGYLQVVAFIGVFFWLKVQGKLLLGNPYLRKGEDDEHSAKQSGGTP